ncbi:hypothetical protein ACVIWU_006710 [Bradyrhizobium sp. USDA 4509]
MVDADRLLGVQAPLRSCPRQGRRLVEAQQGLREVDRRRRQDGEDVHTFVHAATWADDIKTKEYGYTRDAVTSPTVGQNIGYSDHNQHAYWHSKDIDFTPDGTPVPARGAADILPDVGPLESTATQAPVTRC